MVNHENDKIISEFMGLLADKAYPCVAARAAMSRNHLSYLVLGDLRCPADDRRILKFIYEFTDSFRSAQESFHSALIIFRGPRIDDEKTFDDLLWAKLQSLSALDAENFRYDKRVSPDPRDAAFAFSLGEEGFFIIGLHPASSRPSRRFSYPALVFNPHEQFEVLRKENRYERMKQIVRSRDLRYSGSVNPMLDDFGQSSEARQYSGRQYTAEWQCPLQAPQQATSPAREDL